uniref:Uncharacterized protein n=1 Tax=Human herpesvirus 2 TaxID=10310 RepID=A0A481TLT5_HHV2|nr:hypothetical protein [Human alphaherpesvirus 2]
MSVSIKSNKQRKKKQRVPHGLSYAISCLLFFLGGGGREKEKRRVLAKRRRWSVGGVGRGKKRGEKRDRRTRASRQPQGVTYRSYEADKPAGASWVVAYADRELLAKLVDATDAVDESQTGPDAVSVHPPVTRRSLRLDACQSGQVLGGRTGDKGGRRAAAADRLLVLDGGGVPRDASRVEFLPAAVARRESPRGPRGYENQRGDERKGPDDRSDADPGHGRNTSPRRGGRGGEGLVGGSRSTESHSTTAGLNIGAGRSLPEAFGAHAACAVRIGPRIFRWEKRVRRLITPGGRRGGGVGCGGYGGRKGWKRRQPAAGPGPGVTAADDSAPRRRG